VEVMAGGDTHRRPIEASWSELSVVETGASNRATFPHPRR
jgi:hypothetical protein